MKSELIDGGTKVDCLHCESVNCFREDYDYGDQKVSAYLCLACGYTTTTLNIDGSEYIKDYDESCPELFKDLKFVDKDNIAWYPMVLNFPNLGLVFPDGTSALNWSWRAVPIKAVDEDEKEKYPIPDEEGKYYETKADMDGSRLYPQGQFYEACKYLGIIVP